MNAVLDFVSALLTQGVPKIIELVKQGRKVGDIKLSEIISNDALRDLEDAKADAEDFLKNG